jgi:His/Glu/Gln/Arg/opine family amino acid ABC transporter permease subunit
LSRPGLRHRRAFASSRSEWLIWRFLLEGLCISVQIALFAILLSLAAGAMMALGRLSPNRPMRWLAGTHVEVFRATPLLLLTFFVFFGVGRVDLGFLHSVPMLDGVVDARGDLQPIPAVVSAPPFTTAPSSPRSCAPASSQYRRA